MDKRKLLENLIADFSPQKLSSFFRQASGSFRPQNADYGRLLNEESPLDTMNQIGRVEFDSSSRMLFVVGHSPQELTSRSSKLKQFEMAKKILQEEDADAGIFVYHDDAGHFRFSLVVTQYQGTKRSYNNFRRYTYFLSPDEPQRTFVEQIGRADFSSITSIQEAFSVETVTREFFKEYEKFFRRAEASITLDWDMEQKRLYTQKFFNRLVFLAFLERKGWLAFDGRQDYLQALYDDYHDNDEEKRADANFHRKRLNNLFFLGLNNAWGGNILENPDYKILTSLIGDVPYLNGGLFEREADDELWFFPDEIVSSILKDLIYRFNFTVAESTPLDVEVAVDPEMLGKMFEELVTGRHESGSYYTPKPVVAFMCREALKGYLESALPAEEVAAIGIFVDDTDATSLRDPELALAALRGVRACDPACGSGAYLLGLLHELLDLRAALFVSRHVDAQTVYERKLEIIQNNLYGVDIDPFAVNIAHLRLWLSLIVDFEGENPPPLPNLDFKIEIGDSLTAPDPSGGLQPDLFRYGQVQEYFRLKGDYLHAHDEKKHALKAEIVTLRQTISDWAHEGKVNGFDWQVEFAEVFAPELAKETLGGKMAGIANRTSRQVEMTYASKEGGFDIVLANPPYGVSVEVPYLGKAKSIDSYAAFMLRAIQLLKNNGEAQFIVPTSWETGEKYKAFRKAIISWTKIKNLINLPYDIFETPYVDTCIVGFKKTEEEKTYNYKVAVLPKKLDWKDDTTQFSHYLEEIPIVSVLQDSYYRILLSPLLGTALSRLEQSDFISLAEIAYTKRGIEAYQYTIFEYQEKSDLKPFFTGNIYRFKIEHSPFTYVRIRNLDSPYHEGNRIGIRRVVSRQNRIMSAFFANDFVVKKDIYLLKLNPALSDSFSYLYMLGLLNSSLISYLYLARYASATKNDFRQITLSGLRDLLIYKPKKSEMEAVEIIAEELNSLHNNSTIMTDRIEELENELDEFVFGFYGITKSEKTEIIKWLSQSG